MSRAFQRTELKSMLLHQQTASPLLTWLRNDVSICATDSLLRVARGMGPRLSCLLPQAYCRTLHFHLL